MPSHTERSRYRLVGYGFLFVLVILGALPGYLMVDPSWRSVALRLVGALLVVVGCVRVVRSVRRSIEGGPPSALDAPFPPPRLPARDERFLRLRDDLVFSRASRRYFDTVLWPRLRKLGGDDLPAPPKGGGILRGGPSLRTLDRLIAEIEHRR